MCLVASITACAQNTRASAVTHSKRQAAPGKEGTRELPAFGQRFRPEFVRHLIHVAQAEVLSGVVVRVAIHRADVVGFVRIVDAGDWWLR
jgi:hypothetical protein